MPEAPLSHKLTRNGDVCVVDLEGEIDLLTGDDLSAWLTEALAASGRGLVVDMTKVRFLGSAGLAALMAANQQAAGRDIEISLVCGHNTRRTIELTGLGVHFRIFDTRQEALEAVPS
jgi:anti-anti-sigma factor